MEKEEIFKKIIVENFLKLMKDSKIQIQESQQNTSKKIFLENSYLEALW
jgi:hypothetical protein